MAVRISIIILIVALFLLAETFAPGTSGSGASQISELVPAAVQPR